jgi:hypothetical protein
VAPAAAGTTGSAGASPTLNYQAHADAFKQGWTALPEQRRNALVAGGAGLLVIALSTFFTWASVSMNMFGQSSETTMAGIRSGSGKLLLLIALAGVGWIVYAIMRNALTPALWLALAGVGSATVLWMIVLIFRLSRAASHGAPAEAAEAMKEMGVKSSAGFGVYLGLLAGLFTAASFAWGFHPELTKMDFARVPKPLWTALGIGAGAGLLLGFIAS